MILTGLDLAPCLMTDIAAGHRAEALTVKLGRGRFAALAWLFRAVLQRR